MAMYSSAEPKLITHNFSENADRPPKGLVVHVTNGARTLQALFNFFNLKEQRLRDGRRTRSSTHFGIAKDGAIWQFVDTDHQAFAQGPGAPSWISVENCGVIGQALTDEQVESAGNILSWLHGMYPNIPLRLAKNSRDFGLAFHSIDPSWDHNKSGCPGKPVVEQLPRIVEFALAGY
jgi:N-acetyl-anhydromuramyl-L-alanine amidase AmpD